MDFFTIAFIILLLATIIFYIVFVSLVYYWHDTRISYLVVPLIFTFEFFLIGFLVIAIASIFMYYASLYPIY